MHVGGAGVVGQQGAGADGQHRQQIGIRRDGRADRGAAGMDLHGAHAGAQRFADFSVTHGERATGSARWGVGFGETGRSGVGRCCRVEGDHRRVVGADDGDHHVLCGGQRTAVGGLNGVGQRQRLAIEQGVKGLAARIESPGDALRGTGHRGRCQAQPAQLVTAHGGGGLAVELCGAAGLADGEGLARIDFASEQSAGGGQGAVGLVQRARRQQAAAGHRQQGRGVVDTVDVHRQGLRGGCALAVGDRQGEGFTDRGGGRFHGRVFRHEQISPRVAVESQRAVGPDFAVAKPIHCGVCRLAVDCKRLAFGGVGIGTRQGATGAARGHHRHEVVVVQCVLVSDGAYAG